MATVHTTEAYDFSLFESNIKKQGAEAVRQSSAAPEVPSEPGYEQPLRVISPKRQQQIESIRSMQAFKRTFVICCAIAVIFAAVIMKISYSATRDALAKDIQNINSEIAIQKSEKVKLNSQMEKMFNISTVEEYAVNVLGMVKLEDYQIRYVDLSGKDAVLFSCEKTEDEKVGLLSEIKEYFKELFS